MMKRIIVTYITCLLSLFYSGLYAIDRIDLVHIAETHNQQLVVEAINNLAFDLPAFQPILQEFSRLDDFEIRDALNQMSGVQYTNLILVSELSNRQFNRRVFDPVRPYLIANPCATYTYCTYKPTIDFWISFAGGRRFIHGNKDATGFRVSDYDITAGAQVRLLRELTIGGAVFFERNTISYRIGGHVRNNNVLGGFYALYRPKYFYIFADFNGGNNTNKMRRRIHIGNLNQTSKANFQVNQAGFYGELGTDLGYRFVLVQPFVAIESGTYRFRRVREHEAFPLDLSIRGRSFTNASSRLGVHVSSAPLKNGWLMGFDLSWNYRLSSERNFVFGRFNDFDGTSFKVKGLPLNRNSFEALVFINKRMNKCWDVFFEGNGVGSQHTFAYSFIGGIAFTW
jgi:uncharacterized protein with beta-barrel porin domain